MFYICIKLMCNSLRPSDSFMHSASLDRPLQILLTFQISLEPTVSDDFSLTTTKIIGVNRSLAATVNSHSVYQQATWLLVVSYVALAKTVK